MDEEISSPFFVIIFFVLRCLVPLGIMLGISYLLRRFGLITEPPAPPAEKDNGDDIPDQSQEGGFAHGNS